MPVITAAISPYRETRDDARKLHEGNGASSRSSSRPRSRTARSATSRASTRRRARGEIKEFTGVSDPYEEPENPELRVETSGKSPEESAQEVLAYLESEGLIPAS